jgi:hypothetical protein
MSTVEKQKTQMDRGCSRGTASGGGGKRFFAGGIINLRQERGGWMSEDRHEASKHKVLISLYNSAIEMILIALFTMVLILGVLDTRTYQLVDGMTAVRLVMNCELWYYSPPTQMVDTITLACPRTDLIRLWPLPITQPWSEDLWPPDHYTIQAYCELLILLLILLYDKGERKPRPVVANEGCLQRI